MKITENKKIRYIGLGLIFLYLCLCVKGVFIDMGFADFLEDFEFDSFFSSTFSVFLFSITFGIFLFGNRSFQ